MQHQQFWNTTERMQSKSCSNQKQQEPEQKVKPLQQLTTQETIFKEKVHQTTKNLLEEQTTKEKSTEEDCGWHASLLMHSGWTKALMVQEMRTQGQMDQLPSHCAT